MQLVVDASVLVAELLRRRGRALVAHQQLDLAVAAEAFGETEHELRKRMAQLERYGHVGAGLAQQFLDDALALLNTRVVLVPTEVYAIGWRKQAGASRAIPMTCRPWLWH